MRVRVSCPRCRTVETIPADAVLVVTSADGVTVTWICSTVSELSTVRISEAALETLVASGLSVLAGAGVGETG